MTHRSGSAYSLDEPPKDLAQAATSQVAVARAVTWTEARAAVLRRAALAVDALPRGTHGRAVAELSLGHSWNRLLHAVYDLPALPPADRPGQRDRLNAELSPYVAEGTEHEARAADAALIATEWPLLRKWQGGQQPGPVEAARALVLPALPSFSAFSVRARSPRPITQR